MCSDFVLQETRWLLLRRRSDFSGIKGDKIENLIHCLANFKAQMAYENVDFSADKVKQYEAVRKAMISAILKIYFISMQTPLSG